jgi:Flp pilus assembly protein TadD
VSVTRTTYTVWGLGFFVIFMLGINDNPMYSYEVLARPPDDAASLFIKGVSFMERGNSSEAINYFDKALELDPNNLKVLNGKGAALVELGNYTGAIHYYDKGLELLI